MNKYTILLNGGIGKHICATTMLRQIQEKEPDARITVVSGFPEIFLFNPRVYRNLHLSTSYLYDDYIEGTDYRAGDPYHHIDYYKNTKHISNLYPLAYRFPEENDNILPEIYLSDQEKKFVQKFVKQNKPIITIQAIGGNQMMQSPHKDPAMVTPRDLPLDVAQRIVDYMNSEGFTVIHVALPHEPKLNNVLALQNQPFRAYVVLLPYIKGHIGIDSAMMHAAAAFKTPSLIFWNNTNVDTLGYPYMTNVHRNVCPTPMCARPHVGMPDQVPEGGWQCPHNLACQNWTIAEVEEHLKAFVKQIKGDKHELERSNLKKVPLDQATV